VFVLKCLHTTMTNGFVKLAVHPAHKDIQEQIRQGSDQNDMTVAKYYHKKSKWATKENLEVIRETPALIVHGTDDGIVSVECGQHLANHLPNSKLVLLECTGHMIMLEQPEKVADEILLFLDRILHGQ
jgi:pimeloyl-ACP methyl ester carboxylesterase